MLSLVGGLIGVLAGVGGSWLFGRVSEMRTILFPSVVGPVTIEQEILDPAFVQRHVRFEEGEPFNTDKLLKLQLALGDSGFFRRVEVQSRREEAVEQRIPVTIKTVPAPPRAYAWGLGYGTDTGPRVSLGVNFRRINDRGHSILVDTRVSRIYRSIGTSYNVPIGNLVSDRLVFKAGADFEDIADEGNTNLYTLGVSQNVGWGPLQRRLYAEFRYEDYSLGEDEEVTQNLIPGITLSRLRTDDVLFPRRGYSWSADLRGAAKRVSGKTRDSFWPSLKRKRDFIYLRRMFLSILLVDFELLNLLWIWEFHVQSCQVMKRH